MSRADELIEWASSMARCNNLWAAEPNPKWAQTAAIIHAGQAMAEAVREMQAAIKAKPLGPTAAKAAAQAKIWAALAAWDEEVTRG